MYLFLKVASLFLIILSVFTDYWPILCNIALASPVDTFNFKIRLGYNLVLWLKVQ